MIVEFQTDAFHDIILQNIKVWDRYTAMNGMEVIVLGFWSISQRSIPFIVMQITPKSYVNGKYYASGNYLSELQEGLKKNLESTVDKRLQAHPMFLARNIDEFITKFSKKNLTEPEIEI